jgi:hypothetical protein
LPSAFVDGVLSTCAMLSRRWRSPQSAIDSPVEATLRMISAKDQTVQGLQFSTPRIPGGSGDAGTT